MLDRCEITISVEEVFMMVYVLHEACRFEQPRTTALPIVAINCRKREFLIIVTRTPLREESSRGAVKGVHVVRDGHQHTES